MGKQKTINSSIKNVQNNKKCNGAISSSNKHSWRSNLTLWNLWKLALAISVGIVHKYHVSTLFEKDRHFSHLSSLEREMGFRTEMGLYYSYFKTVIEAPSFLSGVGNLMRNNVTEYPDTINTLKRFNLYPEVALGAAFRTYEKIAEYMEWKTKICWNIDRGEGLSMVESCEGLGDPPFFYLEGVWTIAAITTSLMFLLGTQLSGDSCLGGLLAVLCFFYNHGEATRVQWTPPLRESFAFPLSFLQQFMLTRILSSPEDKSNRFMALALGITTTLYIVVWQFAQFSLFTQFFAIYLIHNFSLISRDVTKTIFLGIFYGLVASWILMFGNEMLVTSWLFCCLMTAVIMFYLIDPLLAKFKSEFKFELPSIIPAVVKPVALLAGTVAFKIIIGKILNIRDDAHIGAILRSKFTNYRDFHTSLYTCAKEFDFLGWEMPTKTTMTLLIPSGVLAMILVGLHLLTTLFNGRFAIIKRHHYYLDDSSRTVIQTASNGIGSSSHGRASSDNTLSKKESSATTTERMDVDPIMIYHILQTCAFCLMAIIIMRLKLFFTPQLCILTALLLNVKYVPFIRSRTLHLSLIAILVAGMSIEGVSNVKKQHDTIGEYSNPQLEHLIEWINATVPVEASFAGPMPVMANLLLSTRRPIVNHPHYEDAGLRERTKRVYEMYSRHTTADYHKTLVDLKVHYLVAAKMWCFQQPRGDGCAMVESWDAEEPHYKNKGNSLCKNLFGKGNNIAKEPNPYPFKRVFKNEEYCVLKV